MEPWGINNRSNDDAVEPISPAASRANCPEGRAGAKHRKVSVGLVLGSLILLAASGSFYGWRNSASRDTPGTTRLTTKSPFGKLADEVRVGAPLFSASRNNSAKKMEPKKASRMSGAPLSLPLFFEANRGQTDERVKFLARSSGYTLFVTPTETVFVGARTTAPQGMLRPGDLAASRAQGEAILRMKLLESNPGPEINGAKELPGKVNYLIGKNPRDWHTGVPLYEEVRSREVYPGIDLVFHGDQRWLEYDFQVSPGSDPSRIRFKVTGAEKIAVDENGELLLKAAKTEFRMRKPVIYQQVGEQRRPVNGGFSVGAGKLVAFRVGAYDKSLPLVIDPTIVFASFLGAAGQEVPAGMDLDTTNPSALRLFLSGTTTDITTFTETNTLIGNAPGAGGYAFVAKIDPTSTGSGSLDFLTFIGGSLVFTGGTAPCTNLATDLKLDLSGGAGQAEAVLLGDTNCRDFPVTVGGPTTGTDDLFIARLTPSGAAIDGSTLFGGNGSAGLTFGGGASLFVNPEGSLVLSGDTTSTNFATTSNAYSVSFNNGTPGGFNDCFIAKLDRAFNALYLTYLNVGGNTTSTNAAGCGVGAVDAAGKIYFGGTIYSATAFNLANGGTGANGFQKTFVGTPGTTPNTFIAVLDPSLSGLNQLTYSTYIAGGGGTHVQAGAVDVTHGIAAIVGTTISNSTTNAPDIPLLNAIQPVNNSPTGVGTGFITVIDATKTGLPSLVASTYFGGSTGGGSTSIRSVAIDPVPGNSPTQRIVVGGQTTATNFPTLNPLQTSLVGTQNGFVSVLSVPSPGSAFNMSLLFSTYLGGTGTGSGQGDSVRALITDSNHAVYALGRTASANFFGNTAPATTVNGFQTTCASCGGGTPQADLAVFVLTPQSGTNVPDLTVMKSHNGTFAQGQSGAQYSITVTNSGTGATVGTVSLADSLPSSLAATAMTGTGWSCSISTLVCTRSDALGAGLSYPVITLTVNVSSTAPPSVTNTATVSGGSETNTTNNTASDVATITSSLGACTKTYSGATNGSWGTATNWSTGAVPVSTDVVCIPSGITVLLNTGLPVANQTISALNISGILNVSAGPLTVTNNSAANSITVSGGTLSFNGQLTVSGPVSMTGGILAGAGEVDLEGLLTWSGGTMSGTGKTNAKGGMNILNGSVFLDTRTLNASGTTTFGNAVGGSNLFLQNGAVVNNLAGATWNIVNGAGNGIFNNGGAVPAFNNAGTFEMTGGTSNTISVAFNNTATVMGNVGTLNFSGGGNCGTICSGSYTAGAPGIIAFTGGTFVQSGPINGSGTVNFNGATMNFGSGIETISSATTKFSSGTITNTGIINFTTLLTWTGGSWTGTGTTNTQGGMNIPNGSVFLDTRTLNASGTTTFGNAVGGSNLFLQNGAVVNNLAGATWNIVNGAGNGIFNNGGAVPAFNNAGTFEMTGGTSNTISVAFNNTATVMGNVGTLNFSGGGNCGTICSGSYTAGAPGIIAFTGGTFVQSGPINGSGTVNFNGATMNFGSGIETISSATTKFSSGTITNTGIINFTTLLTWTGGSWTGTGTTNTQGGMNIPNGSVFLDTRTLNASGTTTFGNAVGGSNLFLQNGAVVNNLAGATWNIVNGAGNGIFNNGGAVPAFNNAGTFEMTGGTSNTVSVPFNNTSGGTVAANTGALSFSGGGTEAASFSAATGASLSFSSGTFNFNAGSSVSGAGTANFSATAVNFNASSSLSTATNNITAGTVTLATGTTVTLASLNQSGGVLTGTGTLAITGVFTWSGGTMNGTGVTNANGGMSIPNAEVFLDTRTLNASGTTTFGNATGGSILVLSNGAVVNNKAGATWNIVNGNSAFSNGFINNGGAAPAFNNAGTFEMTGGTSDTISVAFNNTGTVVVNTAALTFGGGGTGAGGWTVSTGGTLLFSGGTFALSGPIGGSTAAQGGGTVNFSGGTENVTGTYNIPGGTTVSGGTANFTGTLTSAGALTISNGTANFSNTGGAASTSVLTLSGGTLTGTASLTVSGLLTWSGGTMSGASVTNANGGMSISNAEVFLDTRTLNASGTTTFGNATGGSILVLSNGAMVNNKAGATWNIVNGNSAFSNGFINNGGAAPAFNNAGTFEMTGGTSDTISVAFNNTGTVVVNTAALTFGGGGTGAGGWTVSTGGTLLFSGGTFALSGPIGGSTAAQGGGTVNFSGGTENVTGTYNIPGGTTVSGGTANFTGTLTSAGALTISNGTANFSNTGGAASTSVLTLSGGTLTGTASLTVSGLLTWSGGTMSGASVTNANGGMSISNAEVFLDTRTLNASGTTTFGNATGGSILVLSNGAVVNNKAGATWNIVNGNSAFSNGFINNGGAAPAFNNAGTFEMTGGTSDTISVAFNNTGTVVVNTAALTFGGGGTGAGGWTVSTGGTLLFSGGTFALSGPIGGSTAAQGGGTVNFSGGTENVTGTYNIPGGTTVSGGTANFTGTLTSAGALTISNGTANFSNTGGAASTSVLTLSGGTLTGTASLTVSGLLTWSGGTMSGASVTNANGGMSISNAEVFLDTRTLNASGTTTFGNATGGSILVLSNGAVVNNKAGATWNIVNGNSAFSNGFINNGGAAPAFNNAGTFEMTGGTSDTISVAFNNTGTVAANAAVLSFQAAYTQTAGRTALNGGTLQTFSTNPLLFQGGSLTGTGAIQADVTNTGGSIAPGSATTAGAISLSGSGLGIYSQSATGAYNVKIGGTAAGQFDTLTMSGAATLGGPLNVSLLNSFSPVIGNTFTILTAASVTGTFSTTNVPALSAGLGWHVTYNATNVALSIVSVSSPVANLNPGSVPFPNTIVNAASAIQKVQLQNTGTAPLIITSIQPTGIDAANYSYTPDPTQPCPMSPASLANGAICMLDIGFLPLTAGTHNNAQITVTDNSGNVVGSTQTVALSGTGIVLSSIAVTPNPVSTPQGSTQQFVATGTYSDSSTQNLSSAVTWASSNTGVATINSSGRAQGVSPGTTNITATQGAVTSPAAVLTVTGVTKFVVSAPGSAIAGTAFNVNIFAEDQFNNVVPGYTGTVHFTSSDGAAVLPANTTLTNGIGLFPFTLKTLGSQTITATDTVNGTLTGTSGSITVGSGLATHFAVSLPGSATVGTATSVTVTALDAFNNVVTSYTGTIHFTSTDSTAVLPVNTALTNGAGTFPVTFKTAGSQTVTATDTVTASISGTSNSVIVGSGTATHLVVVAPPSATAGTSFNITVAALDQFNNAATGYTGTVHFTSTDGAAVLPANSTLTNGVAVFSLTLKTLGSQTVTATDTVTATITGTSNPITVGSGVTTHFVVTAPGAATAGTSVNVSVTALDQFNNLVTTYTGTVHFTSTDGAAVLPANSTLTSGTGVFAVTFKTSGAQTVTATDTVTSAIKGTSNTVTVGTTTATHLLISAPATATEGVSFNFIVTALDQFNNQATGYTGTVHFTSTDALSVMPGNSTLTNGTGTFAATLKTPGSQTITGTDTVTGSITGTSNTIAVGAGAATRFTVSAPGTATAGTPINITVTAFDQFNNVAAGYAGTVHFTSTDGAAVLPANTTLTSGTGTFPVTLKTTGSQTVTATDTVTASITGTTGQIVVTAVLQTITVAPTSASVTAGLTQPFTATGHFSDGSTGAVSVNWTSADNTIATVNSSGVATGVKAGGPITITATSTTNGAISGTAQLTVTAATLQTITVAPTSASVAAGLTQPFTATGHFSDGTSGTVSVNWSSSNTAIATVNASGVATGVTAGGPVTITATSTANGAISGTAQLTVTAAVLQTITVAPTPATVTAGLTQPFTATGHFSDGSSGPVSVNWSSSNTTIATVNVSGIATGVTAGGPITITATSTANGAISGTAQLTVTAATLQTITVAPTSASVAAGLTQPFTATGHFSDGTSGAVSVNWSSSNTTIATINAAGVATGVRAGGPVTITATSTANGSISGTAQLSVTAAVLQTITVAPTSASVTTGLTQPFTATGHFSDGTISAVSVNWSSSNTAVATINTSGVATGVVAGGPITITATATTNAAISGTAQLTVTTATLQTITVAPTSASVAAGLTQPFTATGHFSDGTTGVVSVNWSSSNTAIAIINGSGVATGVTAGGPVTIRATSTTNGSISGTAQLTVTAAVLQTVTVAPATTSVTAGLTQPFTATGHFSDGTTSAVAVNWSSSNIAIATVNASGVATGVAAGGPITITATSGNIFGTAQLTVTPVVTTNFTLSLTLIGTGTGGVTDNLGSINCLDTAGVITGTCSANYPAGTVVVLTTTPTPPSTFGGYLGACTGTGGCSVTMNSAQSVTASFVPPPKMIPVPFTPGTNATGMATYDCPSNPNPSPSNPCLDPNAHANSLTIGQVLTPFTLTVVATEVPPTNGDGICENGRTPGQDLDCRFGSFFTFLTKPNGDRIVPLCVPYANGNCVVYSVFFQNPGQEPDPSMYVGPINWNITYNNGTFVPPAPWTGSTPRLFYDPSGFVVPSSPYGTDCTTPMLIGNPGVPTNPAIFCQFVFDITTVFDASKKVDPLLGGKSKNFSDVVVAFPPIFAPVVTVTTTPDAATVTAGSPIGFTIAVSNSAAAVANNVSLNTPLPGGTNVNWTISPAYSGPGTCAITGAIGSQVLNCAFGTLNQSASASLHIVSASSAAGTAISPSTVLVGTQQLLSIGSIVVQPIPVTFSGLTASQSIPAGTSSVTLGGVIGNATQSPPSGEKVSITINGVTQQATIGSNGAFSLQFPTAGIPGSTTPYPITYLYAGDSLLSSATNNSTTLTVVSPPPGVNLTATLQSATIDASGNYVFTVRITNSGGTAATVAAVKTAILTTVVGTTRLTTASTTTLPLNLGSIASLSSITATLTFPSSAGPPNTAGAISLGFVFTGGSASSTLKATLP